MQQQSNLPTPPFGASTKDMKSSLTNGKTREQQVAVYEGYQVIRRNGSVVPFTPSKINVALMKAFLAVRGSYGAASSSVHESVNQLTEAVVKALMRSRPNGGTFHIEDVQDQVELQLMRGGHQDVARAYVLYREARATSRRADAEQNTASTKFTVTREDGSTEEMSEHLLRRSVAISLEGVRDLPSDAVQKIVEQTIPNTYEGMKTSEVNAALILATRTLIEREPAYTRAAAALLHGNIWSEVVSKSAPVDRKVKDEAYRNSFAKSIEQGIQNELLNPLLRNYDLNLLSAAIKPERDFQFDYLGLQTLYDRYFLHVQGRRIEMPQTFFMRVAMGLALNEQELNQDEWAIAFYEVLSSFDFMSSTPTLFNSGTIKSQLSSCYLTTVADDLDGIYEAIKDNAMLSKFAGGLGNDWTRVRSLGSHIKGTNGKSQGVVPFLKVVNDTAVAVNQGGKRKGAVCAYLETWHLDIEEFLELRKNTGDDRRRCHDMNTANWIPDLFMKRVMDNGEWTLFSPATCPDLHDLYGKEFEKAYTAYEAQAAEGKISPVKTVKAVDLWRKMLGMLFETGHPWITFKDPSNIRSPQQHVGVVHSSNLCTEITLNTSDSEIAVCNLGSINLAQHVSEDGSILQDKIERTVKVAMRMLDNVIDINYYAVKKARDSNLRHRPVGLGMMGFQDALYKKRVPYASKEAVEFADKIAELICFHAYEASSDLAVERGAYSTYKGSLWSQGILPLDSVGKLEQERGIKVEVDRSSTCDWERLRAKIAIQGMRNSNCIAIAPTATISNIVGVDASIEPCFANLSVKSNLSGDFTIVNEYLVRDLKKLNLWDDVMLVDLKHFNGSLSKIDRVPSELKELYATAFEVDPEWLIEAAARRQKWIDQAQSLNLYISSPSGPKLDKVYKKAWLSGLKTTYYLRSLGATNAEKSTITKNELNKVSTIVSSNQVTPVQADPAEGVKYCSIDNPDCESCQ